MFWRTIISCSLRQGVLKISILLQRVANRCVGKIIMIGWNLIKICGIVIIEVEVWIMGFYFVRKNSLLKLTWVLNCCWELGPLVSIHFHLPSLFMIDSLRNLVVDNTLTIRLREISVIIRREVLSSLREAIIVESML